MEISSSQLKEKGHIDWYIMLASVGLMLFSLAFVYSASASFADVKFGSAEKLFRDHAIRVFLGIVITIFFAVFDYRKILLYSKHILFFAIFFLLYVLVNGVTIKGATRWVSLGFISFQPSEFAKFALVLHLANVLTVNKNKLKDFKEGFIPLLGWTASVCFLIAAQPNMSTSTVIFIIAFSVIFVSGVQFKHIVSVFFAGLILAVGYALTAEYRLKRIYAFLGQGDGNVAEAVNYQLQQGLIAFGSGGFWGVGAGQSRQRDWFLPESYGDFIFSIVGEEYGYLGVFMVLGAFAVIVWRGFLTARKAPDDAGRYVATGITVTFALYAFVNSGVTCGLLPTTGLPMPFISYGGTATLFSAAALGILLNISSQAGVYPRRKK